MSKLIDFIKGIPDIIKGVTGSPGKKNASKMGLHQDGIRVIEDEFVAPEHHEVVNLIIEVVRYRKRAEDAEKALEAAADALRKIECITNDNSYACTAHKIAQDGHRAAKGVS